MPQKVSLQKLLFIMPPEHEAFIAAMAAINAYTTKLAGGGIRTDVTLVGQRSWLTDMLVPLSYKMEDVIPSNNFDLAIDMTEERAINLTRCTSRSCASGFGILLGFESIGELIYVSTNPSSYDIAVINWGSTAPMFCQAVQRMDATAKVKLVADTDVDDVLDAAMVVGIRSATTYLAACAGRSVVELYPQDEFESFLCKVV